MDYKKLEELNKLRQSGALTEEEFEQEKERIMNEENFAQAPLPLNMSESGYLALMNFLMLVPYVGWLIPIIMWIMGKDISVSVNRQGRYILNWYISSFIYSILLGIFFIIALFSSIGTMALSTMDNSDPMQIIGMLFGAGGGIMFILVAFVVLTILSLLFPIIGGIGGLNGQAWKYPLSIPFLK